MIHTTRASFGVFYSIFGDDTGSTFRVYRGGKLVNHFFFRRMQSRITGEQNKIQNYKGKREKLSMPRFPQALRLHGRRIALWVALVYLYIPNPAPGNLLISKRLAQPPKLTHQMTSSRSLRGYEYNGCTVKEAGINRLFFYLNISHIKSKPSSTKNHKLQSQIHFQRAQIYHITYKITWIFKKIIIQQISKLKMAQISAPKQ